MIPYASSSSSTRLSKSYDVFMSFRGEDTRMGFTSHLYDALIRNDITTYKDDKTLEIGNPIAYELLEAIEASRIAIVVLSSKYATSKWCLEEIENIVKCMEQGKRYSCFLPCGSLWRTPSKKVLRTGLFWSWSKSWNSATERGNMERCFQKGGGSLGIARDTKQVVVINLLFFDTTIVRILIWLP